MSTCGRLLTGKDGEVSAAPEVLAEVLALWGVPKDADLARAERGTNNQTFAVVHGDRRWVLRISENLSAAQVRAEHRLLGWLGRAGLPFGVPEPVAMAEGGTVAGTRAGPATMCRWIPGGRPDLADERALEVFARAFGVLGEAMRDVPLDDAPHDWRGDPLRVHPAVADLDDLCADMRAAGVRREHAMLLQAAAGRVAAWRPEAGDELPVQVTHGDMAASNALVDEHTGQVTALLDFEAAGTAFRVQDLVVGLLQSGVLRGPQWQRRTATLVRGYASVRRLDEAETRAVPELLICRCVGSVLWRAGRWRRGQARLAGIVERLDRLDETTRWLQGRGDELLSLMASGGG